MNEPRCFVLLGSTGSGKSSLANIIFEDNVFEVNDTPNPGKRFCVSAAKRVNDRELCLIDTPDFLDPELTDINREIRKCLVECAPGPHALLLVLKVEKFTWYNTVIVRGYEDFIVNHFSEDALKFTTVVFTHGEDLPENVKIEDWVKQNEALRSLVQKCGGHCRAFDNKHWNHNQNLDRNNRHQVTELLGTIEETVKDNGEECYTNETLEKLEEGIQQETKRIRAAPENRQVPKQQIRAEAKENVFKKPPSPPTSHTSNASIKYGVPILLLCGVGAVAIAKGWQRVDRLIQAVE